MSTRRISRGTPAMLTKDEQERYVRFLDEHPEAVAAVETLTGRSLGSMTYGEKVSAVAEVLEAGRASAALAVAFRAQRDLRNLAADARGEIGLADRLVLVEQERDRLREQLAEATRTGPVA